MAKHTYQLAQVDTEHHTLVILTEPIHGFDNALAALADLRRSKESDNPSIIYHQDFRIGTLVYRLLKIDRPNPVGRIR